MEQTENVHWVEDLFPPTFGFKLEELVSSTVLPEETEPEDDHGSVFDQLAAHKISKLDITTIRNVYERVWLMEVLEEEEMRKRQQKGKYTCRPGLKRFIDASLHRDI